MKSLFPGLSIVCGTALLIAGNTTAGIVFTVLGFLGAVFGAAIRHQQEQEAFKVMTEFTETLKKSSSSDQEIEEVRASLVQLAEAFGELWGSLTSADTKDPWPSGGNNGGSNLPN